MDIKDIKELMMMLVETDITELNLESNGTKIVIKKGFSGAVQPVVTVTPTAVPVAAPKAEGAEIKPPALEKHAEETERVLGPNQMYIQAEIVGTFYRAPAPGEDPFVTAGQTVEPGQTLCIIEAMKVMNKIECPVRAKILEVLVADAQPVEYGQPLFLVEKL